MFEWTLWWHHFWISQHQSFFDSMYPLNDFGWEDQIIWCELKNQNQIGQLFEEKRVWINERGSDWNWLCWEMSFHTHLGFPSEPGEPCWRRHEVQRFGLVFWPWNIWRFDCDLQVMRSTALWGSVRGICLNIESELEKKCLIKFGIYWKSSAVDIINKQKWKVKFYSKEIFQKSEKFSGGKKSYKL